MAENNAGSVGEAVTTGRPTTGSQEAAILGRPAPGCQGDIQGDIQGQAGDAADSALHLLTQAGVALLSYGDPKAHLDTLTGLATRLARAQSGAFFYSIDIESGKEYTLEARCARGLEAPQSHSPEITVQVSAPSMLTEHIVRLPDVSTHPLRAYAQSLAMPTSHLQVRSFMSVPVRSRSGDLLGGLFFGHTEPDRFAEVDEDPLRLIAVYIALAMENAQLAQGDQVARGRRVALNARWKGKVAEHTAARDQSEQQQFQQLVAGIRDCAIYMLDANGYVVSWNPGAERIKGYTAEEILGQHFRVFCTEEDQASGEPERSLAMALNSGTYESEAWRRRKDGTRFWASVLIDPIWNDDGELLGFAKITRDMTERRAMQEQLYHSQKMEALGQLTGGVAHDFNNLLTVILGNLETLGRDLPKEQYGALHRAVEHASRGARRAAALTTQLLAFSRRQPLTPTPTDVNQLITGTVQIMKQALGENVRVDTVLHAGLWRVDIDVHHLESALLNLAINARDAMPGGGTLTLETANVHVDEMDAKLGTRHDAVRPGDYVVVCVRDTGLGMTEEVMERAFDPFFTTKPVGKGTGLGLSQVFGFVNQSGGYLQLHSTVGAGTRVEIYLPRMTRIVPPQEDAHLLPEPVVASFTNATILVVEDEEDVRVYSADSLREQGFTVLEAQDSDSAMRMLDHHPEVRLMFTDIGLPHVDGWQLADQARMRLPGLKVLFATGYARDAVTRLERLEQGEQILTKPFTGSQLVERVREVLASAPPPSLPKPARVALVVEDEPLVSLYLAETLADLGFEVAQSASAAEAGEMAERIEPPVLAVIDIGLPDRSGLELAEELLHRWPQMKLAIASGYGEQALGNLRNSPGVAFLTKPYDEDDIAAAVKMLGVQS